MVLKPEMSQELRGMVRDVLREVMAGRPGAAVATETVRIANDQDLAQFIARLQEPGVLEKVKRGQLRFTLAGAVAAAVSYPGALSGVITEQKLEKFTGEGTLVLEPGAVLTPL